MTRLLLIAFLSLGLSLTACSNDPEPRDLDQPAPPLLESSGGGDGDEDDAGVESDAATDTDANDTPQCSLEPRTALDPTDQPCCFTDRDCQESDAIDAPLMRCYQSSCSANGEGLCRVPPESSSNECWTRFDCEEGQICTDAYTGTCEEPLGEGLEYPGICVST